MSSAAEVRAAQYKADGNKAFVAGRYADAARAYTIAMQLNPQEKSFYGNRSAAWSKLGQFEKALIDANKAVGFDPGSSKALLRRAVALSGLKMWVAAREDYAAILKDLPGAIDAVTGLAECDRHLASSHGSGPKPLSSSNGASNGGGARGSQAEVAEKETETPTAKARRKTSASERQELLQRAQLEAAIGNRSTPPRVSDPKIAPYTDPKSPPPPPPTPPKSTSSGAPPAPLAPSSSNGPPAAPPSPPSKGPQCPKCGKAYAKFGDAFKCAATCGKEGAAASPPPVSVAATPPPQSPPVMSSQALSPPPPPPPLPPNLSSPRPPPLPPSATPLPPPPPQLLVTSPPPPPMPPGVLGGPPPPPPPASSKPPLAPELPGLPPPIGVGMAGVLAGITGGVALKKSSDREIPSEPKGPVGRSGQPSFRTELKKRMKRKQQSILNREKSSGGACADGGPLDVMLEEEEEEEEEEGEEEEEQEQGEVASVHSPRPRPSNGSGAPPAPPPLAKPLAAAKTTPPKPATVEQPAKTEDEKKWAGLPEWKRKVLEAKAAKEAALNAPLIEAQKREAERKAKIAAMPTWKRNLLEKKGAA